MRITRDDMQTARGRLRAWIDMLFVDHGILRYVWWNLWRIRPGVWRAAVPPPSHIWLFHKFGLKTVVNLRGANESGWYFLEREACEKRDIAFVDFPVKSRDVPRPEVIHEAKALFERIQGPVLMHCKSGADRAGLMSTLYLMLKEGLPVERATRQLSIRFGHFKQSRTGLIDAFFEAYRRDNAANPIDFLTWVDTRYDPEKVKADFHASRWATTLVDRVLGRE